MEVSPMKDPRVVLIETDDGKMLEVEDALPLIAIIHEAVDLLRLPVASKDSRPPSEALKILEDLLPVESRAIRENVILGLKLVLDYEG
ncbi:hypothetical protein ACLOJK_029481 [Asimina triloba]